jgi:excisionase family DNA binding protein
MAKAPKHNSTAASTPGPNAGILATAAAGPAFYTAAQLAVRWGLSERQVHRIVDAGSLAVTRFGRSVRIGAGEVTQFEASRTGVK